MAHFLGMGSGQELFTLHGHSGALLHMVFSPDGTRLVTSGAGQGAVLWRPARRWRELPVLINGGKENEIRGEVKIWHAPKDRDFLWCDKAMTEPPPPARERPSHAAIPLREM
jgi:hypothetical protein